MSAFGFQAAQHRLLAKEMQEAYRLAKAEEERGELIDLADLAARLGFSEADFPHVLQKPEGYEGLLPANRKQSRKRKKR